MQILLPLLLIFFIIYIHLGFTTASQNCKINQDDPSSRFAYSITVDQSGQGDFKTVQGAINSVPSLNDKWIRIVVHRGFYSEKVKIPNDKTCIVMEGEGRDVTTITWDDHTTTDTSATFGVSSENFVAKRITFQNSYNLPPAKTLMAPAVAASIFGDKSSFHECGFIGLQDTLLDGLGRHYFNACYIEGAVDFIFGYAQSFYEDCLINATIGYIPLETFKHQAIGNKQGYITAQGRNTDDSGGFVFERGWISSNDQAYLGRAYGNYSRVIFHDTTINANVAPQGWDRWDKPIENVRYAEINCTGRGYDTSKRVPWLKTTMSEAELSRYTRSSFIDQDGWIGKPP